MTQHAQLFSFLTLGFIILAVAWLPVLLRRSPLSLPVLAVAFGYAFFLAVPPGEFFSTYRGAIEFLLEMVLVIAVMGAGLKIDRPFSFPKWASTWRTLGFGMPLSILGIALCGIWILGLSPGMAVLVASILSPTDPVLASNVQVGPPGVGEEGEVRFALTSEAGLNDGLAYPFVTLGLVLTTEGTSRPGWLENWLLVDVLWMISAAVVLGLIAGWAITTVNQRLPEQFRLSQSNNGLASLGVAFLVYGLAETIDCYGFVAVFTAASTIRNTTRNLSYTRDIHSSAEQIEQLVTALVLCLFGGAIAEGLISSLSMSEVIFVLLVLFVVRPCVMLLSFIGSKQSMPVRAATGFFGIRGLGSLYYTIYAINHGQVENPALLWKVTGFIVLTSVIVYGISAGPVMAYTDRLRMRHMSE